jgi:hypothetical protein
MQPVIFALATGAIALSYFLVRRFLVIDRSQTCLPAMPSDAVKCALSGNIEKCVSVTFTDGIKQLVVINWVDDEGFGHSGPNSAEPAKYWTRFEEVAAIHSNANYRE